MKKLFFLLVLLLVVSAATFAGTDNMPWETGLQQILRALSGNTAKILGAIMIAAAGIAVAFTEGQAIKKLLWVIVGIGIALNAVSFLTMLFGVTAGLVV